MMQEVEGEVRSIIGMHEREHTRAKTRLDEVGKRITVDLVGTSVILMIMY
jgi:hypothetical protein